MTQLFQSYFQMALEASIVILIVLALRPFFRKYSKRVGSLLWIVVFFRLLCPITVEGPIPAFWSGWFPREVTLEQVAQADQVTPEHETVPQNMDLYMQGITAEDAQGHLSVSDENGSDLAENDGRNIEDWLAEMHAQMVEDGVVQGGSDENASDMAEDGIAQAGNEDALQEGNTPSEEVSLADASTSDAKEGYSSDAMLAESSDSAQTLDGGERSGHAVISPMLVFGILWGIGAVAFLLYGICAYVGLIKKLRESVPMGQWKKYPLKISDASGVPMSFGILRPAIYVPASFQGNGIMDEKEKDMILHHEATHLRRRDPLWKLISFVALAIHWWNPLVWICLKLFDRDMEMACDEGVLEQIGQERRGDYAKALLHFAEKRSGLSMAAAFGESNAESRIKETLSYKKRPVWLSIMLSCLVLLLAGCLATKPRTEGEETSEEGTATSVEDPTEVQEPSAQVSDGQKLYGAESVTEDGYYVYAASEELQEGFGERFRDILLKDGKITEDDKFYSYPNVEHLGSGGNGKPAKRSGLLISSWPEGICISVDGNITQYVACLNYYLDEGKYYLGDMEIMDNSKVETYGQAVLFNTFAGLTDSYLLQQDENIPRLFLDARNTFFDVMADTWKAKDPKRYEKLLDPVTAVIEVMHLQGGQGEVIAEQNYGKIVKYTFKDGKAVHYRVKKRGDEWMPYALVEYSRAIRERYPDEYINQREFNEEEWLSGIQKTEDILRTATAAQLRKVSTQSKMSSDPCWEGGKEGDFTILDQITALDATLYGLYGDGGMVLRVGDKTYPLWMSWATLYHGPELYAGDYDGDGDIEYALVVITGTGTGVSKEGLYVIELRENEAEVHEFAEYMRYEELAKRLSYEYDANEKRLTLAIDKGKPDASYVGLFLEGHLPEDQAANWLSGPVEIGFGDQESMKPVDDDLFYELAGGLMFGAEGAPAWPQYDISVDLTCKVQYHADGSFTIGKITGNAVYYDEYSSIEVSGADESMGEEVILEQYADLTRDGVKDVIVTSVTYHEENKNQTWKERVEQYESCIVRVYNGAYEGNVDKETYANTDGYNVANAIWERVLADAHAGNGMVLLCKKDGKDYLLTGSIGMWQGVLEPEYRVFSLGDAGSEYEIETGKVTASVTVPEDVWDVEAMISYTKKLDVWTKNATLLAFADVELDERIGGKFDATESWKHLYASVQEFRDAIEYSGDQPGKAIPKIVPLQGMSNLETSLNSLHECWRACAEWIKYSDNMRNILTDLQPGKNIYTCHLTHGRTPETVTVDYKDAVNHKSDEVLIEVKNHDGETIWNKAVSLKKDKWACYYLTIYEEQAYMIQYIPIHEEDGVSEGYFKMFYLNDQGEEQVICERFVSSEGSGNFEKEKAAFEEMKDAHMGKMNLILGVANGELAIKQVR